MIVASGTLCPLSVFRAQLYHYGGVQQQSASFRTHSVVMSLLTYSLQHFGSGTTHKQVRTQAEALLMTKIGSGGVRINLKLPPV
jgi:hypothetical protein